MTRNQFETLQIFKSPTLHLTSQTSFYVRTKCWIAIDLVKEIRWELPNDILHAKPIRLLAIKPSFGFGWLVTHGQTCATKCVLIYLLSSNQSKQCWEMLVNRCWKQGCSTASKIPYHQPEPANQPIQYRRTNKWITSSSSYKQLSELQVAFVDSQYSVSGFYFKYL